jgi:type II secretory pathway component PulF
VLISFPALEMRVILVALLSFFSLGSLLSILYLNIPGFRMILDRVICRVFPWRTKEQTQTFLTSMSLLLRANVPEFSALEKSSESIWHPSVRSRIALLKGDLEAGRGLVAALVRMDARRPFEWKLQNARFSGCNMVGSLEAWARKLGSEVENRSLVIKHFLACLLVLLCGGLVASFAIRIWLVIREIILRLS